MSIPGSPGRSGPGSRPASRPRSSTRGSLQSPSTVKGASRDPLRILPTDISWHIFSLLTTKELARCSRFSKKWNQSQTLNYGESLRDLSKPATCLIHLPCAVWFQHYRKENFRDESLPLGKWTRRESKQKWVSRKFKLQST